MASLADHGEYRGGEGNGSMRTPFARMALWDGPWRMGYHMGCAAFVLTLNDFPHSAPLLESPSLRLHNNYLCGFL